MEATIVSADTSAELAQILSDLMGGDDTTRSSAETSLERHLDQTPDMYMLTLTQAATSTGDEKMRSFAFVTIRRLLQRRSLSGPPTNRTALYTRLSNGVLQEIERLLLHSLLHETEATVHNQVVDTVCILASKYVKLGRAWEALLPQILEMSCSIDTRMRLAAFKLIVGSARMLGSPPTLVDALHIGLRDDDVEIRVSAFEASMSYLTKLATSERYSLPIMEIWNAIDIIPSFPQHYLPRCLSCLIPLAKYDSFALRFHLVSLLDYLTSLLLPAEPKTPTIENFQLGTPPDRIEVSLDAVSKRNIIDLMIYMVGDGITPSDLTETSAQTLVKCCLNGLKDSVDIDTEAWLNADPFQVAVAGDLALFYQQTFSRLAKSGAGEPVLQLAFQDIPEMITSSDWRARYAGLMAIAGMINTDGPYDEFLMTGAKKHQTIKTNLGKVVELVSSSFRDPHPRVRNATSQCLQNLCIHVEEAKQGKYVACLLESYMPSLKAPEHRIQVQAIGALPTICKTVSAPTLKDFLDPIFERLLPLLNQTNDSRQKAILARLTLKVLADIANVTKATVSKYYTSIMPLLLEKIRDSGTPDSEGTRSQALKCAGSIAAVSGADLFRRDADTLAELLSQIQGGLEKPCNDISELTVIVTWGDMCVSLKEEFEPYLPVVLPLLFRAAGAGSNISSQDPVQGKGKGKAAAPQWNVAPPEHAADLSKSSLDSKAQALSTLTTLTHYPDGLAPYIGKFFEVALSSLQFRESKIVRKSAAILIPVLIVSAQMGGLITEEIVSAALSQFADAIGSEVDIGCLSNLYICFTSLTQSLGGPGVLSAEVAQAVAENTSHQLESIAKQRKSRRKSGLLLGEKDHRNQMDRLVHENVALKYIEQFFNMIDVHHPLLTEVKRVQSMGLSSMLSDLAATVEKIRTPVRSYGGGASGEASMNVAGSSQTTKV